MKTEDNIKVDLYQLYKIDCKINNYDKEKLDIPLEWALSCAFLFADKKTEPIIYIDDDYNFCFDFIEKNRYLSISIESSIYYYAFVYQENKGRGKGDLFKEDGDSMLKRIISKYFSEVIA